MVTQSRIVSIAHCMLVLVVTVALAASASAAVPYNQVVALNELFSSTSGKGWTRSDNWGVTVQGSAPQVTVRAGECAADSMVCAAGVCGRVRRKGVHWQVCAPQVRAGECAADSMVCAAEVGRRVRRRGVQACAPQGCAGVCMGVRRRSERVSAPQTAWCAPRQGCAGVCAAVVCMDVCRVCCGQNGVCRDVCRTHDVVRRSGG